MRMYILRHRQNKLHQYTKGVNWYRDNMFVSLEYDKMYYDKTGLTDKALRKVLNAENNFC